MRKKLDEKEKKVTVTVSINPLIMQKVDELYNNKSKYIENLIAKDLFKNKHITEIPL